MQTWPDLVSFQYARPHEPYKVRTLVENYALLALRAYLPDFEQRRQFTDNANLVVGRTVKIAPADA